MTFRAFWYGCWFSHAHETHWTGHVLTCQRCGEGIPVLAQKKIPKGEKHQPDQVRGIPNIWAKTVRKDNVIQGEWKRSER